jgi:hypothetical protein
MVPQCGTPDATTAKLLACASSHCPSACGGTLR